MLSSNRDVMQQRCTNGVAEIQLEFGGVFYLGSVTDQNLALTRSTEDSKLHCNVILGVDTSPEKTRVPTPHSFFSVPSGAHSDGYVPGSSFPNSLPCDWYTLPSWGGDGGVEPFDVHCYAFFDLVHKKQRLEDSGSNSPVSVVWHFNAVARSMILQYLLEQAAHPLIQPYVQC